MSEVVSSMVAALNSRVAYLIYGVVITKVADFLIKRYTRPKFKITKFLELTDDLSGAMHYRLDLTFYNASDIKAYGFRILDFVIDNESVSISDPFPDEFVTIDNGHSMFAACSMYIKYPRKMIGRESIEYVAQFSNVPAKLTYQFRSQHGGTVTTVHKLLIDFSDEDGRFYVG